MKIVYRENTWLIFRFILYYFKCCFGFKLNFLDKQVEGILEEYNYYYDFKNDWKKR